MPELEVETLNLFDLYAKISLDTSEYDSGVKDVEKSGSGLASKLKSGFATAGKAAAAGLGLITTAAGAVVGGLSALEASTEQYRIAQGRLNTAFESAGYGAEAAKQAYSDFYGILGDTDRATEASQLLARLAENEKDLSNWTKIAAGVNGTFGDSLPIESLIESANEAARTGQVVGTLADALNWAGSVGEDEMNVMLESCSSEAERNQLIMETLAETYNGAADAFYKNNEALMASRDAQVQMDEVMARLGQTVSTVKGQLTADFLPALAEVADAFNAVVTGADGADEQFSSAIGNLVNTALGQLPNFLSFGTQIVSSLLSGIVQSVPTLVAAIPQVVSEIWTALGNLLPQVVSMGVQLLDQLTTGIESGLPDMVSRIPVVIDQFLEFITSRLPDVLETGVELLNNLVNGIVDAIPQMVAALPKVITSFTEFIKNNLPEIASAGMEILLNLVAGIISAIPSLIMALPQIIEAIVNGIDDLMYSVIEVGKRIVEGIWSGITGAASWLKNKVTGFFGDVVDGVKDFLGIQSPSKVFASIGEYMMSGLAVGMENSAGEVMETVDDIVDEITNRFSGLTKSLTLQQDIGDLEYEVWERTLGQNATDAQKYEMQLQNLNRQEQIQSGIVQTAAAAYEAISEQYGENSAESLSYQKTLLEESLAYQDLVDQINEVIAAKEKLYAGNIGNISYAESTSGRATAETINAIASGGNEQNINLNANLVLEDGSKLATWQLPFLIRAADANGTPIAEGQRA